MTVKIVQIIIEADGQLCHARIPEGMERMILSFLQGESGSIQAVKLPESVSMVSLSKYIAGEESL